MSQGSKEIVFKSSDGKLVKAVPGFIEHSHLVSDLMHLQLDIDQSEPIEFAQIHSQVLEQINYLVEKLENEELKGVMPIGKYDDALWNDFTIANLRRFNEWTSDIPKNMLIHIANVGQYLQMKAITHISIIILTERAKGESQTQAELRQFLNESDEMDEEMRLQLEKAQKAHPDL